MNGSFDDLLGKQVVLDTDGPVLYIGILASVDDDWVHMEEVDVHHMSDSVTGREKYIIDTRALGVRANRKRASVRLERVVGVSLLEDILEF